MKYWIHLIIILLVGFAAQFASPWWSVAVISILTAYFLKLQEWTGLLFGLLAGFILWALVAFYADIENQGILSLKIGNLFGGLGSIALIAITGLIGGVIAGLGSFVGASVRGVFEKRK